jgi:hypothetical protein
MGELAFLSGTWRLTVHTSSAVEDIVYHSSPESGRHHSDRSIQLHENEARESANVAWFRGRVDLKIHNVGGVVNFQLRKLERNPLASISGCYASSES